MSRSRLARRHVHDEEVVDERAVAPAHGPGVRDLPAVGAPRDRRFDRALGEHADLPSLRRVRQPFDHGEAADGPRDGREHERRHLRRVRAVAHVVEVRAGDLQRRAERVHPLHLPGERVVVDVDVLAPLLVELAVRLADLGLEGAVEVVDADARQQLLPVLQDLHERRVAVGVGEVAHLAVADGVLQPAVPRRGAVGVAQPVLEDGRAEPAVAALRVPLLGLVLREALGPEARDRVREDVLQQADGRADRAVVEDVGDLVRHHLPQPLHVARPDLGRLVDVDPDVREPRAHAEGDAVRDLVLVREVDPDRPVERHVRGSRRARRTSPRRRRRPRPRCPRGARGRRSRSAPSRRPASRSRGGCGR